MTVLSYRPKSSSYKFDFLIYIVPRFFASPVLFFLLLLAPFNALTQTSNQVARKFDEFGDALMTDIKARADNFAVELQNEPAAKGFIIVYHSRRDLPGISNRYAIRVKDYLVNPRGVEKERVVTVDGGEADCLAYEFWIVPPGTAPKPRYDAYQRNYTDPDAARKIDEYGYAVKNKRRRRDSVDYPTRADLLETFATELRREKRSFAYIVAYAHFSRTLLAVADEDYDVYYERRIDPPGTAVNELRLEKNALVKIYGVAPSRIRLIDGGYRKWRGLELWIVPRGEHPPIPTPNSFPPTGTRSKK